MSKLWPMLHALARGPEPEEAPVSPDAIDPVHAGPFRAKPQLQGTRSPGTRRGGEK